MQTTVSQAASRNLQDADNEQHGVLGLAGKVLEEGGIVLFVRGILVNVGFVKALTQLLEAVLPAKVHLGLVPIIAGTCQDV